MQGTIPWSGGEPATQSPKGYTGWREVTLLDEPPRRVARLFPTRRITLIFKDRTCRSGCHQFRVARQIAGGDGRLTRF